MATMLSHLLGHGSAAPIAIAIKVVVIFQLVVLGAYAAAEHRWLVGCRSYDSIGTRGSVH